MFNGKYIAALCVPRIHEGSNHKLIASLSKHLFARNIMLMVFATPTDLFWASVEVQGEKSVFELINYEITDLVIIQDEVIKDKSVVNGIISSAKAHNKPVITIGSHYEGCANIKFDYSKGFEQIVRHVLKDHSIIDFHYISGIKDNPFSKEREDVVKKVAAELDIPFSDEDISYGEFWSQPTEEAIERLFIRRRRLPQAIICANDTMAIAAINSLKRHYVRVPEDIIVTGFDGINDIKYCVPRVTTCLCSSDNLAECIADAAVQFINGEAVQEQKYVIPVLQRSESCGCKSTDRINPSEELMYINNTFFRFQIEEEHMFRMMSRTLQCNDFSEISDLFDKYDFYDMIIALKPECIDRTINPLAPAEGDAFGDTVKIIYNTNHPMHGRIDDMQTRRLHPDLEDIINNFDAPLIFLSLSYMGKSTGYVCFNFHDYDIQNYYKASQIVNTLNSTFGAIRIMQYQHYLSDKIEEMYRCDGLTHLLNRMALKKSYTSLLEKCNGKVTVILADLDDLKGINDNFGHDDGDYAICAVANALKSSCPDDSLLIRWGGDEMVAVIPGGYSSGTISDAIHQYLSELNKNSGKQYVISASVGAMTFNIDSTTDFEDMVKAADQLMYREKKRKKAKRQK